MKKLIYILTSILILGTTVYSCQKSYDPGDWSELPEYPIEEEQQYTGPSKTLKIMSVNMNLGNTFANFPAMVAMIKAYNPDLLLLRQCDSKTTRANGVDRPQEIANELGMNMYMKGRSYNNGQFGNAVLSKFPISETLGYDLTKGTAGEQRMLAMIKVKIHEGVEIYFGGTELETNADDRRIQITDILQVTQNIEQPLILAGNFNEQQASPGPALTYVSGTFKFACPTAGCAFNAPKAAPTGTYDYITYQDSKDLLIMGKNLEPFRTPETANTFFPTTAEIKVKLPE